MNQILRCAALLVASALGPAAVHADDGPDFGSDVSLGYAAGAMFGSWPQAGVHGAVTARYDAFVTPMHAPGPRLGLSLWGQSTVWPLQTALEDDSTFAFGYRQFGAMSVLRFDPQAPVSGLAGIGFGRIDLTEYHGGVQALPTLTFEAGLRQGLGRRADLADGRLYLDWALRGHWATARSPTEPTALHEWWMVQLALSPGVHLR